MIEIDLGAFLYRSVYFIHMDAHTACVSMYADLDEGRYVDEQLFAQLMGWA